MADTSEWFHPSARNQGKGREEKLRRSSGTTAPFLNCDLFFVSDVAKLASCKGCRSLLWHI